MISSKSQIINSDSTLSFGRVQKMMESYLILIFLSDFKYKGTINVLNEPQLHNVLT